MVDLKLQAELKQSLELLLAPRLLEMLKTLQLPYLELVQQLAQASEDNVLLEVERCDEYAEFIRYLNSDRKIRKEADFAEMPGLENVSRVAKTLEEHLLEQLEYADLTDKHKEIARELIGNIDDKGYLLAYPQLRERIMTELNVSRPTVDKVLTIIQDFEPDGVGARDLKECLLLQIAAYNFENEELAAIIEKAVKNHLADLEGENYQAITQALGTTETGVKEIANFIKQNLNPYPGAGFGGESRPVIPSFAIEPAKQGYQLVNLEERYGPIVKLSPHYLKMLDDPKTDAETIAYLKAKLKKAKELLEDYSKRSETLGKIVRKIIDSQGEFLAKGLTWLKPLTQKSLAEEFGLHPSTISRAVADKYIQTPHGLFSLKLLCPRGTRGLTAGRLKSLVAEIIKSEDKQQPLTDGQIMNKLQEKEIKIDRRTVAFYRQELGLPTALERQA